MYTFQTMYTVAYWCMYHLKNNEVSTTGNLPIYSHLTIPAVISISETESESDGEWIQTPPGTPPLAPTHTDSPPAYYVQPDITSFDFTPPVEACLRSIIIGPWALCLIDIVRDFECSSWNASFLRAGLSEESTSTLEGLFLNSLTSRAAWGLVNRLVRLCVEGCWWWFWCT